MMHTTRLGGQRSVFVAQIRHQVGGKGTDERRQERMDKRVSERARRVEMK